MNSQEYKARLEAAEAWNSWRGRFIDITAKAFLEINHCNDCALVFRDGKYNRLPPEEIEGFVQMHQNGAFIVPWPKIEKPLAKSLTKGEFRGYTLESVFDLRARWCALFPSVVEYREDITKLLRKNDLDNELINSQLSLWNSRLSEYGFRTFEENDLRGINLGGLDLNGPKFSGINLRHMDLSFAECSVAQLSGACLYGSIFCGASGWQVNMRFAIAATCDFFGSHLIDARYQGTDLAFAVFNEAKAQKSHFNGAYLHKAQFKGAELWDASFAPLEERDGNTIVRKPTDLTGVVWSDDTNFRGVNVTQIDRYKYPSLHKFIKDQHTGRAKEGKKVGWIRRVFRAIEAKPGLFGFSIDLKALLKILRVGKR